jgi:hypothetical protein
MQVILVQCSPRLMGEKLLKCFEYGSERAHMLKSQMKTLLITFFNIMSIVHFEFIS